MLPPGVLHMSALGCFGRFTLFSPRVSHSNTCRLLSFVCFVLLFGFVALVCFCFLFFALLGFLVPVLQVSRNPEFSAQFRPR